MRRFNWLCLALLSVTFAPISAKAEAIPGVWIATLGANHVGIKFLEEGAAYCGVLYWLGEPKTAAGDWKLDSKNPAAELQPRRLLGLTLLGRLKRLSATNLKGRIYVPDPEVPGIGGLACDVSIAFNAAAQPTKAQAKVEGIVLSKCHVIGVAKNPVHLLLNTVTLQGPTADDAKCNYKE